MDVHLERPTAAANSLVEDRDLVTKVYFLRLLAPLAAALAVELFITLSCSSLCWPSMESRRRWKY
jgi:ABC-type transport system involved in cytochrome bd biosynthesis fused ATPase/permease subunit